MYSIFNQIYLHDESTELCLLAKCTFRFVALYVTLVSYRNITDTC